MEALFPATPLQERTPFSYRLRSHGGLGIGLALVRSLVGMHGGRVEAVSAGRGHGSEFIVRLPMAECAARDGPPSEGAMALMS